MPGRFRIVIPCLFTPVVLFVVVCFSNASAQTGIDLTDAVVVREVSNPIVAKASEVLIEEVRERTGVQLSTSSRIEGDAPAIVLGTPMGLPGATPTYPAGVSMPTKDEAYALWVAGGPAPRVYIVGVDGRGVLFGVGRLLRALEMRKGEVSADPALRIASAPGNRIRGHQLGYRNANNTWDAWTAQQFEQYIRDLIVFGANAIELIPDTGGNDNSPHMKLDVQAMNAQLCRIIDSYGIDVWTWHALNGDMAEPEAAKKELETSRLIFQQLPVLDAVFVPGGDPGETAPVHLMPFLEKFAANLREVHPGAELWVSTQGFELEDCDYFFTYLAEEKPEWLTGVIFGPWAKMNLKEISERTPKPYRVRTYPDVTHTVRCQYPVPNWDRAFANTLGRECANPRPLAQTHIHGMEVPLSEGFVTYSDGVNDDVNKIVWTARGWDPDMDVKEILRQYGRYFYGADFAEDAVAGLLGQEQNWVGPLATHAGVDQMLSHWQAMEAKADAATLQKNWRFQLGLLRAYCDAYLKARLLQESDAEAKAYAELAKAADTGAAAAVDAAQAALAMYDDSPAAPELRARIEKLGQQLFDSIGMQLSVEKYGASGMQRGAVIDGMDQPLNDRLWLDAQLAAIRAETDPAKQLEAIDRIVNWETPAPGAIYDDLGNAQEEPHLVHQKTWEEDPGFVESPQDEFANYQIEPAVLAAYQAPSAPLPAGEVPPRLSWLDQAQTLFRTDLLMRYEGLDPAKTYTLRAVYQGRFHATMTLTADEQYEVHGPVKSPDLPEILEFAIPAEATADGVLDLRWKAIEGRGPQVAETWLIPNP
ncbi:MAG: hypothetical protein AMXMBFR82_43890 [Candidatus Hydrogenedentota bacterium]